MVWVWYVAAEAAGALVLKSEAKDAGISKGAAVKDMVANQLLVFGIVRHEGYNAPLLHDTMKNEPEKDL